MMYYVEKCNCSHLLSFLLLYVQSLVRAVAEGSVRCLLAVAQPVLLSLRNGETYRSKLDFEKNVFVRAVTQRLTLALTTETPWVISASFETYLERLLVVYHSVFSLKTGTVRIFKRIHRYWRFLGLCGETQDLKITRQATETHRSSENDNFLFYFILVRKSSN